MACSEARLDTLEAQRSTGVFPNKRRPISFPNMFSSLCFSQNGKEEAIPPLTEHDDVPELLTNLGLSDLYDLPGEYVAMTPEIFSDMRSGNINFREKMKSNTSYTTPLACFKDEKGDSILHLAAAWGNTDLVKDIVSQCPSLLLDLNWKDQLPLHVAARSGHSTVVKVLVASVTYFSARLSEEDRETLNLYVMKDTNGDTALHLAMRGLNEKVELCKNQPCKTLFRSRRGREPFSDAKSSSMETATVLVNANQHVSFLANNDHISPLYLAAVGNVSLVNAMLNLPANNLHGRTINLASQIKGKKSIIHAALKAEDIDFLDVILKEDESLVKERDEEGRTCLSVGASVGFYEGICRLLDISTTTVYECDVDGSFPIHRAVENGHIRVVEEILERCPGSECLVNKQGQNMLHIAAKNGKGRPFLERYVKKLDRKKSHLVEEQDVDGNTPLHLATENWHPLSVSALAMPAAFTTKIKNIRNKKNLTALDMAESRLHSEYVLRERLTLIILRRASNKRGVGMFSIAGLTLKSKSDVLNNTKYKDHINALLMVAALVATVTFAAGFTIPGGFNSSSPNLGMSVLAKDDSLSGFLMFDTIAMQFSVIAIIALIWAQLGDPEVVNKALFVALLSLLYSIVFMSLAFLLGIRATIRQNTLLTITISIIWPVLFYATSLLLFPYVLPFSTNVFRLPSWFVNEDEYESHCTCGSGPMCEKRMESVEPSSETDEGKNMDTSI